jgi:hypothetical protein
VKTLQWGQSPWDDLKREQLLRSIQQMYAAFAAIYSIHLTEMDTYKLMHERNYPVEDPYQSPYYGKRGVGGAALEMCRQVLDPLYAKFGEGMGDDGKGKANIYGLFYQFANDLLFENNGFQMIGHGWAVCPECGAMFGRKGNGETAFGKPCSGNFGGKLDCAGVLRPLTWDDLKPKEETNAGEMDNP